MNSQQSEDRNPDSHPEPDSMVNWTEELDQAIDERFNDLVALRRHIHMHPEPSGAEQETSAFVADHLREGGLEVKFGPENRGLIVEPNRTDRSELQHCIAIRADLDALRIHDAKTTAYRSQVPRVMHACGHDGHAAVVVGTLVALQRLQARISDLELRLQHVTPSRLLKATTLPRKAGHDGIERFPWPVLVVR